MKKYGLILTLIFIFSIVLSTFSYADDFYLSTDYILNDDYFDEDGGVSGLETRTIIDLVDGTGEITIISWNISNLTGYDINDAEMKLWITKESNQDITVWYSSNATLGPGDFDDLCPNVACPKLWSYFTKEDTTTASDGNALQNQSFNITNSLKWALGNNSKQLTVILNFTGTNGSDEYKHVSYNEADTSLHPKLLIDADRTPNSYYISNTGNDFNDGLTPENPIKTISQLNTIPLIAGDIIYFNGTFRGPTDAYLSFDNGNSSSHITYTSYADGAIFLGSYSANNINDWVDTGGNIWRTNFTSAKDVGAFIADNETIFGTKYYNLSNLTTQGDFMYNRTDDYTYVYSVSNPGIFYSNIELPIKNHIFFMDNNNYITIEDIDFKYGSAHGIEMEGASHNITIRKNRFRYIGGSPNDGKRYGNGIQSWNTGIDILVEYNNLTHIFDAAITPQGYADNTIIKNWIARNNIITDSYYCIEFFNRGLNVNSENILFEKNTCYNTTHTDPYHPDAVQAQCFRTGNIDNPLNNCSFIDNLCLYTDFRMWNFKNAEYNWNVNYNHYLEPIGDIFERNDTEYSQSEFNLMQIDFFPIDSNSSVGDPLLIPGSFIPYSDSPLCGAASDGGDIGAVPCSSTPSPTPPPTPASCSATTELVISFIPLFIGLGVIGFIILVRNWRIESIFIIILTLIAIAITQAVVSGVC